MRLMPRKPAAPMSIGGAIHRLRRARYSVLAVSSLAIFLDVFLWSCAIPLMPRIIAERTSFRSSASRSWAQSVLFASCAIGLLIATPVVGIITDILRHRRGPMIAGLAAMSAATILFAFGSGFPLLVLARFLQGVSAAVTFVVGFAMIGDTFPASELGTATGIALGAQTLGDTGGLLMGGLLGQHVGLSAPFVLCALLALVDLAGRMFVLPPAIPSSRPAASRATRLSPRVESESFEKESIASESSDLNSSILSADIMADSESGGMVRIARNRDAAMTLVVISCFSMLVTGLEAALPPWMQHSLGYTETDTGLVMLAFIIPQIFLSPAIGKLADHTSRRFMMAIGLVLLGLLYPSVHVVSASCMALYGPFPRDRPYSDFQCPKETIWMIVIAAFATGCSCAVVRVPATPRLAAIVGEMGIGSRVYGRLYALVNIAFSIGMVLGPLGLSALAVPFGLDIALRVYGVSAVLLAPLYLVCTSADM